MDALADVAVAELTRADEPTATTKSTLAEAAPVAAKKHGTSAASGSKSAKVPKMQLTPEEKFIQAAKRRDRRARAKLSQQEIRDAQRLAAAYQLQATDNALVGPPPPRPSSS